MPEEKSLPKPELDLPLPEKDLPLPEKEFPAGDPEPAPKPDLAKQSEVLLNDKEHMESIPEGQLLKAQPQVEPIEENHSGRKKMIFSSFIFGIIFVIIILLIGAVVILSKQNSKPQNTQVVKTQIKPVSPTPNPTSDWESYTDNKDSYLFKYPSGWFLINKNNQDIDDHNFISISPIEIKDMAGQTSNYIDFEVYDNPENLSIEEFVKSNLYSENLTYNNFIIGGIEGKRTSDFPGIAEEDVVLVKFNNAIYKISLTKYPGIEINPVVFDQILSTFTFASLSTSKSPDAVSPTPATSAENFCPNSNGMSYNEALEIASSSICAEQGTILNTKQCNPSGTGYWWLDFTPTSPKSGCNPACVVDVATKKAEINWRCTGLVIPQN